MPIDTFEVGKFYVAPQVPSTTDYTLPYTWVRQMDALVGQEQECKGTSANAAFGLLGGYYYHISWVDEWKDPVAPAPSSPSELPRDSWLSRDVNRTVSFTRAEFALVAALVRDRFDGLATTSRKGKFPSGRVLTKFELAERQLLMSHLHEVLDKMSKHDVPGSFIDVKVSL